VLLPAGLHAAEIGLLLQFNYRSWLAGFLNIMADLHLQACSLLQLLPHLSINSLQMIFFFFSPESCCRRFTSQRDLIILVISANLELDL